MLLRICIRFLLFVILTGGVAERSFAQTEFDALCESWSDISQKMTEKYAALNSGDSSASLADEYKDLVDEANKLIDSIRTKGQQQLKSSPGDGKVIRALLGIMVHDAQNGRDQVVLEVGQSLIDAKINPKYFEKAAKISQLDPAQRFLFEELSLRHAEAVADDLPRVKIETSAGEIVLELFENEAPNTVRNFISLVESKFYVNKLFHRVIEDFVAQGGGFEIEGIGSGGPDYEIECECGLPDARRNFPGTIAMAHAGRDTGGSQFFINFGYNKKLDRKHTVFGRVIDGFDTLEKIERTDVTVNDAERSIEQSVPDKIISATILRKRDHSYRVRKKGEPELSQESKSQDDDMPDLLDLDLDETPDKDKKEELGESDSDTTTEPAKQEEKSESEKESIDEDQDSKKAESSIEDEKSEQEENSESGTTKDASEKDSLR